MSNLQWTERAGEGVTAQHKASVGKQQSWKTVKNLWIKYNFLKSKSNSLETLRSYRDWKRDHDQSVMSVFLENFCKLRTIVWVEST